MRPIKFSKFNQMEIGEPPILTAPILISRYGDGSPEIITCWQLSWWERLIVLFRGKLFVQMIALHPVPVKPSVDFAHVQEIEKWYEENNNG